MIHPTDTPTTDTPINLNLYPLSDEEIRQFDDEGYLIVRNVLDPPTIDRLIEVSDQLMASDRRENRQLSHNELYDSFRNCIAIDDAFIPLLTHPKILSAVVQLLGAHIQLMTSHLIYKHLDPPGTPDTLFPSPFLNLARPRTFFWKQPPSYVPNPPKTCHTTKNIEAAVGFPPAPPKKGQK